MLYGFVMILLPIKKYATLLVLRPNNARIGQPCSRSFKGHVVSRGLNLSRCCARCRAKKASQIIFKVVCLQNLFSVNDRPKRLKVNVLLCQFTKSQKQLQLEIRKLTKT